MLCSIALHCIACVHLAGIVMQEHQKPNVERKRPLANKAELELSAGELHGTNRTGCDMPCLLA